MFQDLLIPFMAVGLAELGDKTQLAVLALSSKTKKHLKLLLGVVLAFVIADGAAILLGDYITNIIPRNYLKIGAGLIFLIFGIITLLNNRSDKKDYQLKTPFISGFILIFISELGDKTQIASALFATKYTPIFVFIGVILALTTLSLTAIYLGKLMTKKINHRTISTAAGILFIFIGIASFIY